MMPFFLQVGPLSGSQTPASSAQRWRTLAGALALAVGVTVCAADPDDDGSATDTSAISGGKGEAGYTSTGALFSAYAPYFACSGELIARNVVVTAAHCFTDAFRDSVAHRGASAVFNGVRYSISAIETNPSYLPLPSGLTLERAASYAASDLGVVYLKENVNAAVPVARLGAYGAAACDLKIVGFGYDTNVGPPHSGVRRSAYACSSASNDPKVMIGTAAREGGGFMCRGDSGGGVYVADGTETLLVGVLSMFEGAEKSACGNGHFAAARFGGAAYAFLSRARQRGPSFLGR